MYKILVDEALFCDSRVDDLAIINPVVKLKANTSGSFSFTITSNHPYYDLIRRRNGVVSVYRDEEENPIFQGICTEETVDFYKQKKIYCEGELTYFNDSILRPAEYKTINITTLLSTFIGLHNAQVEESKQFEIGNITVSDDYINCSTNMQSTFDCIKENLVDVYGGFLRVRYENGHKYIDYLVDSPKTALQTIELGKNLTKYESNIDDTDIATRIIPLGSVVSSQFEDIETKLTIESVNDGKDYLENEEAVENFGTITKTVVFKDISDPQELKNKGQLYLEALQFDNVVIKAGAVDLGYLTNRFDKFELLDYIHIISAPHGMDKWFTLTEATFNLNNPEKDSFLLGETEQTSLSVRSNKQNEALAQRVANVPSTEIMNQAIASATSMISGARGGFVKINADEDGKPYEILVMDTDSTETAQKVWRWNQNGFGYSSTGYDGEYGTAITMDGSIVADYITAGTIRGLAFNEKTDPFYVTSDGFCHMEDADIMIQPIERSYENTTSSSKMDLTVTVYVRGIFCTVLVDVLVKDTSPMNETFSIITTIPNPLEYVDSSGVTRRVKTAPKVAKRGYLTSNNLSYVEVGSTGVVTLYKSSQEIISKSIIPSFPTHFTFSFDYFVW